MIEKLYNLKKTQTEQKVLEKSDITNKIEEIDSEVMITQTKINTTSVDRNGAISDFAILQIHKNTMNMHISKLINQKNLLSRKLEKIDNEIVELQKETEQFAYLLKEEKKKKLLERIKKEEEATEEFMQSKYIAG